MLFIWGNVNPVQSCMYCLVQTVQFLFGILNFHQKYFTTTLTLVLVKYFKSCDTIRRVLIIQINYLIYYVRMEKVLTGPGIKPRTPNLYAVLLPSKLPGQFPVKCELSQWVWEHANLRSPRIISGLQWKINILCKLIIGTKI